MKKIVLTMLSVIVAVSAATAQMSIRPELGINFANMKFGNSVLSDFHMDFKGGPRAGAYVKIPVINRFFMEPGLLYLSQGYAARVAIIDLKYEFRESSFRFNTSYMQLPLNLGYDLVQSGKIGNLFITAGPYIAYAVGGKKKVADPEFTDGNVVFGSRATDDMRRMDWGANFGLGYQIPLGLYIRMQYSMGLANLTPAEARGTAKNYAASLSIGYNLPFKRK